MRRFRSSVAALIMLAAPPLAAQNGDTGEARLLDEIVAKVNNEIITLTDLNRELSKLERDVSQQVSDPAQREKILAGQKKQLLKTMIYNMVMLQRAEELGMAANVDVDVAAFIEQTRVENNIPDMATFERALQQQGLSMAEYRRSIKEGMTIQALMQQFVYGGITLLTPEIEEYYREHQDEFGVPAEVDLAEILLLAEGRDRAQLKQQAEDLVSRLAGGGADFAELAKEYSDGPTAGAGGAIGTFKPGQLNEELEKVAFSLAEGEVSGVLERDIGFQIVKVVRKAEASVKPMEEVRDQISNALYQIKAGPAREEFLKTLVEESYIFVAEKYAAIYDVKELVG